MIRLNLPSLAFPRKLFGKAKDNVKTPDKPIRKSDTLDWNGHGQANGPTFKIRFHTKSRRQGVKKLPRQLKHLIYKIK